MLTWRRRYDGRDSEQSIWQELQLGSWKRRKLRRPRCVRARFTGSPSVSNNVGVVNAGCFVPVHLFYSKQLVLQASPWLHS